MNLNIMHGNTKNLFNFHIKRKAIQTIGSGYGENMLNTGGATARV